MIASSNELLYFIELTKTLNFSRASERIGIAQPSLSNAIKRLEYALGTTLFIRDKHKVVLTQAGHNLLLHTKQLLQLWDSTKASCLMTHNEVQGTITLGCHPSVALDFLPRFLPGLLASNPKLELNLKHDLSRKIAEEIINFTVDVGIVVNPIQHPNLIIKKLLIDEVTFWQSEQFSSNAADLNEKIILCDPELHQTQFLLKKIKPTGLSHHRMITSNNLEVIASLTAKGIGIGILPGSVANSWGQTLLRRLPNAPVYQDEICLVYRHENRNIKAIQVIIEAIKQALAESLQN